MPTPFPGMDPYLERRRLWESVHTRLMVAIADELAPKVRPQHRVDVEQRVYLATRSPDELVGIPDVLIMQPPGVAVQIAPALQANGMTPLIAELPMPEEIVERFLEVREVTTDEVITVIELISPTNKSNRDGRQTYLEKRQNVLGSRTHLIEIDLLRSGQPFPSSLDRAVTASYRIVVSRVWQRPHAHIYLFGIQDRIPAFPVPLRANEPEPLVDLNRLLHEVYDRAGYDLAIDYRRPADPPLMAEDAAWADALLSESDLR